ncbi:hypothetical protein CC1G_15454 [Coprinopsis cinerea okayama7|uniref:DUF6533 domain-containing protein n=1 Tax=Coprinopsis cinerea (strain Okayama-7 / 130 / ATCC MYA-4618 / FGSC 9003) TaxID=240176 RepID=D6RQP6_COPC7|nr:hypothetical protein CC1G_15454 [Coprinopsis cinerea okayama7\|eukprot:XP_002910177.1 hypothetical protein CC1G_15454 [Coprinopsis cinerea okayama7\
MSEAGGEITGFVFPSPEVWAALAKTFQTGHYWQAAGTAVVLYDHLTTLDLEIELVWRRKWSYVKVLYILNRYLGDALFLHGSTVLNFRRCPSAIQVQAWLGMVCLWAMNGLIINRILCMYEHRRRILYLLLTAYAIHITAGTVLTAKALDTPTVPGMFSPKLLVCMPSTPPWFWSYAFFTAAFESLVFTLSLIQGIRYYREAKTTYPGKLPYRLWSRQANPIQVLFRDSILFPFIGMTFGFFGILAFTGVLPIHAFQYVIIMSSASSPILGCRLLLNLRDAYYKPFRHEANLSDFSHSDQGLDSLSDPRMPLPVRQYDLSDSIR